jgi:hypothetical protein
MRILATLTLLAAATLQAQLQPRSGMVITSSVSFRPGIYRLDAPDDTATALIVVRGNDITLDLTGVELRGADADAPPDRAAGIAILVDGGSNVTITNAKIRGYRFAIVARGTRNLRLLDSDLGFNWKPRLYSIVEHESLADWLSFHHNERREWMRFGAAMYLEDVTGGEIRGNTVQQSMNALLLTRTDSMLVWNNDFSFNSGLGIGMYRSDHNRIMHNRMDYNVRGYSEGFYRRGQDSAGILIYEQSDSNVVAFNSATHSGDGLFLWAGQHTMDTGQGGANDNLFYQNDFSWAPTNAMEATFSRNAFVRNRAVGSDYGLWGGYSFGSLVADNWFERNRIGIAIEHGQDNAILSNSFLGDTTAIHLWANPIEPGDWGYPKHRDTRSRDYTIAGNTITGSRTALRILQSHGLRVTHNRIGADTLLVARDTSAFVLDTAATQVYVQTRSSLHRVDPLDGGRTVLPSQYASAPRSTIIVDEWGPYDWQSPKLWPADSSIASPLRLRVLGPRGRGTWRLVSVTGATISKRSGSVGDTILVLPASARVEDWTVTLEYRGQATRSPNGVVRSLGEPYVFSYSRFDARPLWDVKVFAWADSTHPLTEPAAFKALLLGEPLVRQTTGRLRYMWNRPLAGWPQNRAALTATTSIDLPGGDAAYRIRAISDDGIRVYVDERLVIDDWTVHESRVREASIPSGRHRIRVEYFQESGWAELWLEILKRRT